MQAGPAQRPRGTVCEREPVLACPAQTTTMSIPTILVNRVAEWYRRGNRWWLPLALGLFYSLCLPPFNHETHPLLAAFPLLGFLVAVPLMAFAVGEKRRRALLHVYLYGLAASVSQYYWIGNVAPEGQRHLIFLGLSLTALYIGLFYLLAGVAFRVVHRAFPRLHVFLFPAFWVLIEYARGFGEIAFPWTYLGYVFTPYLATAQLASLCGVFGLSYLVVLGNVLVWEVVKSHREQQYSVPKWIKLCAFSLLVVFGTVWGAIRLHRSAPEGERVRVALIQSDIDQLHWTNASLDTSLDITRSLILETRDREPDLIVLPESGVFTYLERRGDVKRRVEGWSKAVDAPMVVGSLHWEPAPGNPYYRYRVYNTAFFIDTAGEAYDRYHKIMLVPVSEAMPFEADIPILGRLNLGEADFKRGTEHAVFRSGGLRLAPFICYEVIFPGFVRKRVEGGANLLVNITNDGWFGRSSGPYQHAAMARMRSIENGVSLARCANSGISMAVDQFGRIVGKTGLYTRTVLTADLAAGRLGTLYARLGDWPVYLSALAAVAALAVAFARRFAGRRRSRRGPGVLT